MLCCGCCGCGYQLFALAKARAYSKLRSLRLQERTFALGVGVTKMAVVSCFLLMWVVSPLL